MPMRDEGRGNEYSLRLKHGAMAEKEASRFSDFDPLNRQRISRRRRIVVGAE